MGSRSLREAIKPALTSKSAWKEMAEAMSELSKAADSGAQFVSATLRFLAQSGLDSKTWRGNQLFRMTTKFSPNQLFTMYNDPTKSCPPVQTLSYSAFKPMRTYPGDPWSLPQSHPFVCYFTEFARREYSLENVNAYFAGRDLQQSPSYARLVDWYQTYVRGADAPKEINIANKLKDPYVTFLTPLIAQPPAKSPDSLFSPDRAGYLALVGKNSKALDAIMKGLILNMSDTYSRFILDPIYVNNWPAGAVCPTDPSMDEFEFQKALATTSTSLGLTPKDKK